MKINSLYEGLNTNLFASVYNGPGLKEGVEIGGIVGSGDPEGTVLRLLYFFLSFAALAATIAIIIAGIYVLFSGYNDENRDIAKRIIWYAVIGLIVIAFATTIVQFVSSIIQ